MCISHKKMCFFFSRCGIVTRVGKTENIHVIYKLLVSLFFQLPKLRAKRKLDETVGQKENLKFTTCFLLTIVALIGKGLTD